MKDIISFCDEDCNCRFCNTDKIQLQKVSEKEIQDNRSNAYSYIF